MDLEKIDPAGPQTRKTPVDLLLCVRIRTLECFRCEKNIVPEILSFEAFKPEAVTPLRFTIAVLRRRIEVSDAKFQSCVQYGNTFLLRAPADIYPCLLYTSDAADE